MPATQSVSTATLGHVLDGTHFLQVSTQPCKIFNLTGVCGGSSGTVYYLQILGVAAPSTGVTVPLFSVPINGALPFAFDYNNKGLDTSSMNLLGGPIIAGSNTLPVYVAVSSTFEVWTSVAGNVDVDVTFEESVVSTPNQTLVALTGPQPTLAVFTNPNPARRLISLQAVNATGAAAFLYLFAEVPTTAGATPIAVWPIANSIMINKSFGTGLACLRQNSTTFAQATGCYLVGDPNPNTVNPSGISCQLSFAATYI